MWVAWEMKSAPCTPAGKETRIFSHWPVKFCMNESRVAFPPEPAAHVVCLWGGTGAQSLPIELWERKQICSCAAKFAEALAVSSENECTAGSQPSTDEKGIGEVMTSDFICPGRVVAWVFIRDSVLGIVFIGGSWLHARDTFMNEVCGMYVILVRKMCVLINNLDFFLFHLFVFCP